MRKIALAGLISFITASWTGVIILAFGFLAGNPHRWELALLGVGISGMITFIYAWHKSDDNFRIYPLVSNKPLRIEIESNRGHRLELIDLPIDQEKLYTLAKGLAAGLSLSEVTWCGSGRPFTRPEFTALRSELLRRKLATWASPGTPARGVILTPSGRAVVRRLVAESPTPASTKRISVN